MGSLNKAILIGHCGRDAELRYTPGGAAVAKFSMATTEKWNDKYSSYYARRYLRVLTGPEVVDAIAQVTGRPFKFQFSDTEVERVKQLTYLGDIPARRGTVRNKEGMDIASLMNSFFEPNREAPLPTGNRANTVQG